MTKRGSNRCLNFGINSYFRQVSGNFIRFTTFHPAYANFLSVNRKIDLLKRTPARVNHFLSDFNETQCQVIFTSATRKSLRKIFLYLQTPLLSVSLIWLVRWSSIAAFTLVYHAITSVILLSSELIFCLRNEETLYLSKIEPLRASISYIL